MQKCRRRSIRLAGYDYAQPGAYFVTIRTHAGESLLGDVVGGVVMLSLYGKINQVRYTAGAPVWQRNYYERVIRTSADLERVRRYIVENPLRWDPNGM
jgi:hypothetical protein